MLLVVGIFGFIAFLCAFAIGLSRRSPRTKKREGVAIAAPALRDNGLLLGRNGMVPGSWANEHGQHDMLVGPCCCGAWHQGEGVPPIPSYLPGERPPPFPVQMDRLYSGVAGSGLMAPFDYDDDLHRSGVERSPFPVLEPAVRERVSESWVGKDHPLKPDEPVYGKGPYTDDKELSEERLKERAKREAGPYFKRLVDSGQSRVRAVIVTRGMFGQSIPFDLGEEDTRDAMLFEADIDYLERKESVPVIRSLLGLPEGWDPGPVPPYVHEARRLNDLQRHRGGF